MKTNDLQKKNEGATTRGQAPFTPVVPLRRVFFDEENLVLGNFFIIWLFEEKVNDYDLYQYYASNSCVTNTFAES